MVKVDIASLSKREIVISILFIAVMFFVFGFVTWLNAVLIPYFKITYRLSNFQSYLVTFAFYISYFVMSVPASFLLKLVGFKKGIMIGFWVMALGALIFIPAALLRTYEIFLGGLFTIGLGLAILQTAANPYITILGPKRRAAQRIGIMGICNKGAGIIAPLLLGAIILRTIDADLFIQLSSADGPQRDLVVEQLMHRLILPYLVMAALLILLGFLVRFSPLPEIDTEQESLKVEFENKKRTNVFQFPHLILGAFAIFFHVGSHVISIDTIITYAGSMGIPLHEAKYFASYTLFATMCGYLFGIILIPKFISQLNVFRLCTFLGLFFSFMIIFSHGNVRLLGYQADISIWFVVMIGFANSMIWAGIWPLALDGLGKFTKVGSSIMIMGLCGNAILPLFFGYLSDRYDLRHAYWLLVPCFLYLIFYGFHGYRVKTWSLSKVNGEAGE